MGNNKSNSKRMSTGKHAMLVCLGTFFLAFLISYGSQYLMDQVKSLIISFILLLIIIIIGIIFDIVGISAAAAQEAPFHARASRRLVGAKQSIWIVRNADKVSNFCGDVVGDICGTVSGAIGISLAAGLIQYFPQNEAWILGTGITGFAAAITVGGKAYGKSAAISEADQIILRVGQVLAWFSFGKKASNIKNRKVKGH